MKIYNIKLRTVNITNSMIKRNVKNFFSKKSLFSSEYIIATVKAIVNNKEYYLITRALVNRKDKLEIKSLATRVVNSLTLQQIVLGPNSVLSISFTDTDLSVYNSYKSSLTNLGKRFYSTASK